MRRTIAWTGIGLGVMLVCLLAAAAGVMTPAPTGRVADGLYAVKDVFVDLYVVRIGAETVCIDAGLSPGSVEKGFRKIGIDPASVGAVFFTHSDRDHVGGARAFKNAVFYMPESEVRMVDGTTERVIFGKTRTNRIAVPYKVLKDGQSPTIGGIVIRSIPTPGHTPGSTSYVVNSRWLFTGDLLMLKRGRAVTAWKGLNMDTRVSAESAGKLARELTGIDLLLTSHGGVSRDFRKAMAGFGRGKTDD
jgi:glyoxylase-like metal-dependent hydrolase (beta-lactamase superfamily II)